MVEASPFFSVDSDVNYFNSLVREYGLNEARKLAVPYFAGGFRSQNWEATGSKNAFGFSYFLSEDSSSLVLDCEQFQGKDMMDGINEDLRNGLEYEQMMLVKQILLGAEIKAATVWISPKKTVDPIDKNCMYPRSLVNIATRISEKEFQVRQYQNGHLGLEESSLLLSRLSGEFIIQEQPSLGELMLTIGGRPFGIGEEEVQRLISEVTKFKHPETDNLADQVSKSSLVASRKYLEAIEQGITGEVLKQLHVELLKNTIDINLFKALFPSGEFSFDTSCGRISSVDIPSWCSYDSATGEIRCNLCKKGLKQSEINEHRCRC